ncbi:MAG: HAMP domain-containing sensor histidine kinase [Candidatus Peregrinibacteria bacterium]|nr:HAMP domain-containing sensor histidine kinase [Candidatus Peregrinibacteria bacterium]
MALRLIKKSWLDISYLPLIITACIAIGVLYIIYNQTQSILKDRLRERMVVAAGLASTQIDASDVEKIRTKEDLHSDALKNVIASMRRVRNNIKDAKYVYILRPTQEATLTQFVADADMIDPVDWDGNGKIDEVEIPPLPGDDYDISDNPTARLALASPTAASDTYTDKWGTLFSAYAPIRNKSGEAVAVIGVDVQVDQFSALTQAMRTPLTILGALFLALLTLQTASMIGIWSSRVKIFRELDVKKTELLGFIAHQLRSPVTAIKWEIEAWMDEKISKELKEEFSQMQRVTVGLYDLIEMLINLANVELKKAVESAPLDLNEFFKAVVNENAIQAEKKKVHFKTSIPSDLPAVMLDRKYANMPLSNLLGNAIKYTPEGGTVDFTVEIRDKTLYCTVKDTGRGIPKEEQHKIFEKQYRASNVKNLDSSGNGFGLYIAKEAIEAQGGKIWFESEGIEGKGTTFSIALPVTVATSEIKAATEEKKTAK